MAQIFDKTWALMMGTTVLFTVGCAAPKGPTIVEVVRDYRSGQYANAFDGATKLQGKLSGRQADEAAYMAGMSGYRLGKDDDALKYLVQLSDHKDDDIAGPSGATVALVFAKRGNHQRALDYFQKAVKRLKGNDQAQAYYHMAVTQQKLGLWNQARPSLTQAHTQATDDNLKVAATERMKTAGFTIQFGAYSTQKNADDRARRVGSVVSRAGLTGPRVVTGESKGRTLYFVQAGQFGSYEAALSAMRKLGLNDVVVQKLQSQ